MKKTAIIYGNHRSDLQQRSIEELTKIVLDLTGEYPVCVTSGENIDADRRIYIGTKENNPHIRARSSCTLTKPESYAISVQGGNAVIEGFDDAGVLYGVLDFYNHYIVKFKNPQNTIFGDDFWGKDEIPDFFYTSAPCVRERGLWTWGHVIYDYQNYLRNMMKLKLNSVIIWNDFVPVNARQIVEFAHSCNIKVIWGFAWLWDTRCDEINVTDLREQPAQIFRKYQAEYADTGADGIYFQTFTELKEEYIGGVLIAEAAADFVNRTAALFYEKCPDIRLQFGLHATSVKDRLEFIRRVDSRIQIVWEDCGAFPFSYFPTDMENFESTKAFVERITALRSEEERFGAVTKGLTTLDWSKFYHLEGCQCIGVSSQQMRKERAAKKAQVWRYLQAGWLIHADKAQELIRQMCRARTGDLSLYALVEDGLFEENILYPAALCAEIYWDCERDIKQQMYEVALREYVTFA